MDFQTLLQGTDCSCGKHHACPIHAIYIENGASARLTKLTEGYRHVLLVADENTYAAAGREVEKALGDKLGEKCIFPGTPVLLPNEAAIHAATAKLDGIDLIVGVGSGVLQDLCKYLSAKNGMDYMIVATAPSMDGYASSGAAMILGGMKVTVPAGLPKAILADPRVLAKAPLRMIQSGYGDILGKYSALNDWKLSRIVNNEYFCPFIHQITEDQIAATLPLAEALKNGEEKAVGVLMEALLLVGIAMSFAGNSRPASGSEHHLSHFFEITGIVHNRPYLPHGTDVVFSTVLTAAIRQKLRKADFHRPRFIMEQGTYEKEMVRVYGTVADGCMALQKKLGAYEADRMASYLAHEEEIKALFAQCPAPEEITEMIRRVGLPLSLFCETYTRQQIDDAVLYAKELKDRYTVLWMYYDLFGLEPVENPLAR